MPIRAQLRIRRSQHLGNLLRPSSQEQPSDSRGSSCRLSAKQISHVLKSPMQLRPGVLQCSSAEHSEGHPIMCTHTRTCTSTVHRVRGLSVRPFSITPPCRQPHSVFGGFYLPFRKMRFVMSGAYHPHTRRHNHVLLQPQRSSQHQQVIVAFGRGKIFPTEQDITTFYLQPQHSSHDGSL